MVPPPKKSLRIREGFFAMNSLVMLSQDLIAKCDTEIWG